MLEGDADAEGGADTIDGDVAGPSGGEEKQV